MTKSSGDVIESPKAPTSERAPKRTADLGIERPSSEGKRTRKAKESEKSPKRVRGPRSEMTESHKKEVRDKKRGRKREPESADVRESSKKNRGPRTSKDRVRE